MATFDIAQYRLFHQGISRANFEDPAGVVKYLLALQAQDYQSGLWSIGLRLQAGTISAVEQAIANREIVRTWPMRGTLHFVAAADARWMLKLLTPRIISSAAARYRQLELDEATFLQSGKILANALAGGRQLTRQDAFNILESENISTFGQRGIHILGRLSQEGLLCMGSHQEKQPTFVLLDEWILPGAELTGEEALVELARRYFTGHGPATLADLERWAGLKRSEARLAFELVKPLFSQEKLNGQTYLLPFGDVPESGQFPSVYLLPGFDEYILGYKERSDVLAPEHFQKIVPGGNGVFMPTIVVNGQVAGTWRRALKKYRVVITAITFREFSSVERQAMTIAAENYGSYLKLPVEMKYGT